MSTPSVTPRPERQPSSWRDDPWQRDFVVGALLGFPIFFAMLGLVVGMAWLMGQPTAAEVHDGTNGEAFVALLMSVPHWLFEGTTDLVFAGIGLAFGRVWVRRHDAKHHHGRDK